MANYLVDHNCATSSPYINELERCLDPKLFIDNIETQLKYSFDIYSKFDIINEPMIELKLPLNTMISENTMDTIKINEDLKIRRLKNKCKEEYLKCPQSYQKYKYYSLSIMPLEDNNTVFQKVLSKTGTDDYFIKANDFLTPNSASTLVNDYFKNYPSSSFPVKSLSSPLKTISRNWNKKYLKRKRIFTSIAKKDIPKAYKIWSIHRNYYIQLLNKVSYLCAEEYDRRFNRDNTSITSLYDGNEYPSALSIAIEDPQESLLLKETRSTCLRDLN